MDRMNNPGERTEQLDEEDVLATQIREGLSELNRPTSGLFLSALSAGSTSASVPC